MRLTQILIFVFSLVPIAKVTNQSVPVHFLKQQNTASRKKKWQGMGEAQEQREVRHSSALACSAAAEHPLQKVNISLQYGQRESATGDSWENAHCAANLSGSSLLLPNLVQD